MKKFIKLLSLIVVIVPLAFAFVGCGKEPAKPHTHAYSTQKFYAIEKEEQVEKVYAYNVCDCGDKQNRTLVENAIIVDNTTVNSVVYGESDITNKVVVLKKGTYTETIPGGLKNYHNVVIAGEYTGKNKEVMCEGSIYFYMQGSCTINGLEISNISSTNRIFIASQNHAVENLNINNCKFKSNNVDNGVNPAILLCPKEKTGNHVECENTIIKDCEIDGYYQGILAYNVNGLIVENNLIQNTIHNALGLQLNTGTPYLITGTIVIKGNTMKNMIGTNNDGQRAIRFNKIDGATITIENNNFVNAVDSDNELIRSGVFKSTTFTMRGNKYNGRTITKEPVSGDATNTTEYFVAV